MAILAASSGRRVAEVATEMVHICEVIDPRPDYIGRFRAPYIQLINELEFRGWVQPIIADHARRRAEQ
jgi:hypothetical protein